MMTNARLPPLHSFPSSHRCLHLTLVYLRISKDRRKNLELTSVRASPEAGVWRVAWRTTPEQSKAHEAAAAELPLLRANTAGFLCLSTLPMKEGWPFRSYRSRTGTFREESVRVWLCIKASWSTFLTHSNFSLVLNHHWDGFVAEETGHQSQLAKSLKNYKSYSYPYKCRNHVESKTQYIFSS